MTQEEQQQVNAMRAYFERQCANLASEGANAAMTAESFAIRAKKSEDEAVKLRAELEALKPKPETNVVPITEPAT